MTDVFVSYSRPDEAGVERLVRAIEAHGIGVWWDRSLEQNADFGAVIDGAIDNSKIVLVCWSESAAKSKWVRGEAARGDHQGKYSGVLLQECLPPTPFNMHNNANLKDWSGAANSMRFIALLESLATRLERPDLLGTVNNLRETPRSAKQGDAPKKRRKRSGR